MDAPMVAAALSRLDLSALDLVLIENVGNLVCPAEFEVGEHRKLMVYAVTEGEDKPLKYPVMFRSVGAVVVNRWICCLTWTLIGSCSSPTWRKLIRAFRC